MGMTNSSRRRSSRPEIGPSYMIPGSNISKESFVLIGWGHTRLILFMTMVM
jgi:hypothetical protein